MLRPRTSYLASTKSFPRNRLYQVLGFEEVESVSPIYVTLARYYFEDSPATHRNVLTIGIDPSDASIRVPGVREMLPVLRQPDRVLMDRFSRAEFAPAITAMSADGAVELQLDDRHVTIMGLFELGTSFGIDGSIITSDLNFQRIVPNRNPGLIELGLIRLHPGADRAAVQQAIRQAIPNDVLLLTTDEYVQREVDYWSGSTPIGYVFTMGAVIGVLVGLIIVYQILFSDVQTHLAEYATLKAMGYTLGYLRNLVFRDAVILSILGFIPALGLSMLLYNQAEQATQLPLTMTLERGAMVFGVTVLMCAFSGMLRSASLKAWTRRRCSDDRTTGAGRASELRASPGRARAEDPRRPDPRPQRRRSSRADRPVGLGQEHPAHHHRRPAYRNRGRRAGTGHPGNQCPGTGAGRVATAHRLHLSAAQSCAGTDRRPEHPDGPAVERWAQGP
jgi:putative ABC transport system permease protein